VKLTSHSQGQLAESACCKYLQQQGMKLLTRNYRGKRGEIDIVMEDNATLVFVEVRYRKNNTFGGALESITAEKQSRVIATAEQYLQQETKVKNCRIDVVAMSQKPQNKALTSSNDEYTFEWIKNAF
jgi:putative endonuclease